VAASGLAELLASLGAGSWSESRGEPLVNGRNDWQGPAGDEWATGKIAYAVGGEALVGELEQPPAPASEAGRGPRRRTRK
jgi:hypothetical protein